MTGLTNKIRALIHLYDQRGSGDEEPYPLEVTQEGVAEALDMPRSHVTRVVRPLIEQGLIDEFKGRVRTRDRKLKVYLITPMGISRVRERLSEIKRSQVEVFEKGDTGKKKVSEIIREWGRVPLLQLFDAVEGEESVIRGERLVVSDRPLNIGDFVDREGEMEVANDFLDSEATVMVAISNRGYGSSTFIKKVALDVFDGPLFWWDLEDLEGMQDKVHGFMNALGCEDFSDLRERGALLCFDNYYHPEEQVVDRLIELKAKLNGGKTKMGVAMKGDCPSYARFYQKSEVDENTVVEVPLGRLDKESAKRMLGMELEEEAMQLVYLLTRGWPLALELLKQGDDEGLRALFPNEEVRFLMYLRSRKKMAAEG